MREHQGNENQLAEGSHDQNEGAGSRHPNRPVYAPDYVLGIEYPILSSADAQARKNCRKFVQTARLKDGTGCELGRSAGQLYPSERSHASPSKVSGCPCTCTRLNGGALGRETHKKRRPASNYQALATRGPAPDPSLGRRGNRIPPMVARFGTASVRGVVRG